MSNSQFYSIRKECHMLQTEVPSGYCKNHISLSIQNRKPFKHFYFHTPNHCVSVWKSSKNANNTKNLPEKYGIFENDKNENISDEGCGRENWYKSNNAEEKRHQTKNGRKWLHYLAVFWRHRVIFSLPSLSEHVCLFSNK